MPSPQQEPIRTQQQPKLPQGHHAAHCVTISAIRVRLCGCHAVSRESSHAVFRTKLDHRSPKTVSRLGCESLLSQRKEQSEEV